MQEPQWQRRTREADETNPARMMKASELVFEVLLTFGEDFGRITKEIILVIFYYHNDNSRYLVCDAYYMPSTLPST